MIVKSSKHRLPHQNSSGQAMSEYLILVMLVAAASTVVATKVGKTVVAKLDTVNTSLSKVTLKSVRGED